MHPNSQPPVPSFLHLQPLTIVDYVTGPQDPHDYIFPLPNVSTREPVHHSPIYSIAPTPPDRSPHLPFDDTTDLEAAIINSAKADPVLWAQVVNQTSQAVEPSAPPADPRTTEPQVSVEHVHPPPPDEVGMMSGSTLSGLPLPPLWSPPGMSEAATHQRAWSYTPTPSSSSAAMPASLGNGNNLNASSLPLPPPMQPQYARLSEREAAAVEREAAALRASQSHGHSGQSEQRNAWANTQTPAQVGHVGRPPQHTGQSLPPTGHSLAGIKRPNTTPTSRIRMDPTLTSLRPAVFSSPSPESDPAPGNDPPPPPSTTASNLTSRNSSRQVSGDSVSTEVPMAIDPIAGCKRTAEEAFAGGGAPNLSGDEGVGYSGEDLEMVDELMEDRVAVEAEEEHQKVPVFIHEDGQRPPLKRRKFSDSTNTHNTSRGMDIRLPPPPSLAGTSRPPLAPSPTIVPSRLNIDIEAPDDPAAAPPASVPLFDPVPASANLPPPVSVFQRDPDAPPSYADWVRENQLNADIERWMECTRQNLVYDPSAVPAPPEGFESGKDRKKEGESGEGTSADKEGEEEEGEGEGEGAAEGEGGAEKGKETETEGNTKESAEGSGTGKPYEINENTPPNINEGLWCLFDYPKAIKPKYSYAFMARVAILGSPTRRLQLQDIYVMIEAKFPFYRNGNHVSWKVRFEVYFYEVIDCLTDPERRRTRFDITSVPTSGLSSANGTWSMNQGIVLCGRWIQPRKEVSPTLPNLLFKFFGLTAAFRRPKEETRATRPE